MHALKISLDVSLSPTTWGVSLMTSSLHTAQSIKVRLHAAICRLRFIFWRMRNTADAIIQHRSISSIRNLKCDLFTRVTRMHTPECES